MLLEFSNNVKKHFDFLLGPYGFKCTKSNNHNVTYENQHVFITIHFDNGISFELDICFGHHSMLFNENMQSFNLGELLRLYDVEKIEGYTFFQAATQNSLNRCIEKLSLLLKKYGHDVFTGNNRTFARLNELRLRECSQYARQKELTFARKDAEQAWQRKDYHNVVELYSKIYKLLTKSEKRKLDYAKKQIKGR